MRHYTTPSNYVRWRERLPVTYSERGPYVGRLMVELRSKKYWWGSAKEDYQSPRWDDSAEVDPHTGRPNHHLWTDGELYVSGRDVRHAREVAIEEGHTPSELEQVPDEHVFTIDYDDGTFDHTAWSIANNGPARVL